MRIEINVGGLRGVGTILEFADAVDKLDNTIEDVLDTFQTIKKAIPKLSGGTGKLDTAVTSLESRIAAEAQKRTDLREFGNSVNDFINLAMAQDRKVEKCVMQNRMEYYLGHFTLSNCGAMILDSMSSILEWLFPVDAIVTALEVVVDFIVDHGDEILAGLISAVVIIGGIIVIAFTFGAAAPLIVLIIGGAIGGALIGFGLGSAIAGYNSCKEDGELDWCEYLKGGALGAVCGAAFGACIAGGAAIAGAVKAGTIAKGAALVGKMGLSAGTGMSADVFIQTIASADGVGFQDYDIKQTLLAGLQSAFITGVFEGFKFTSWGSSLADKVAGWGKNFAGTFTSQEVLKIFISKTPEAVVQGIVEEGVGLGIDFFSGNLEEGYGGLDFLGDVAVSIGINLAFAWGESMVESPNVSANTATNSIPKDIPNNTLTKQVVPNGVDVTFSSLNSEVNVIKSKVNYFDDGVSNIERGMSLKQALGGENIRVRSVDLSAAVYQQDGALSKNLKKNIGQMSLGETFKLVLPNDSISSQHIKEINDLLDFTDNKNIKVELHTLVLDKP